MSKKTFEGALNPADAIITGGTPASEPKAAQKLPKKEVCAEAKSKRVMLLTYPTLYAAVQERAKAQGVSVNETINRLLLGALGID